MLKLPHLRRFRGLIVFVLAVAAIAVGIACREPVTMFGHAIVVCLSCIGLG